MPTPCFLFEETSEQRLSLRRFGYGPDESQPDRHACPGQQPWPGGHRPGCDARSPDLETIPLEIYPPGDKLEGCRKAPPDVSCDDPRWPAVCAHCGQPFGHDEEWQEKGDPIMRVVAAVPGAALVAGTVVTLRDAPGGAMWFADWIGEWGRSLVDGRALVVRLPDGHDWRVDGEATNCTRPGDRTHRCWLREGEPPYVTAGKTPHELTCAAGAGSILSPGYHGFLANGVLT